MLLDAIVADAPRGVAVIATLRDDVGSTAAARWIDTVEGVVRVTVPPLDEAASADVVRRAAERQGLVLGEEQVARAARASGGRPFMAEVLGEQVFEFFLRAKWAEWHDYTAQITPWEIDTGIDL